MNTATREQSTIRTNGGNRTTTVTYFKNTSKWIIRQVKDETYFGRLDDKKL